MEAIRTCSAVAIGQSSMAAAMRAPRARLPARRSMPLERVHWFNTKRLLAPIGDISPSEYEKAYYTAQEGLAVGAGLT